MVHKKYSYRNGKRYGPYYYENKRVDGKIITTYLGDKHPEKKVSPTFLLTLFLVFIVGISIFFLVSNYSGLTGKVVFNIETNYAPQDSISGQTNIILKSGEFIPSGTRVVVSLNDQEKTFLLGDLIEHNFTSGKFYTQEAKLIGQGNGFGLKGSKISYPKVSFDLMVYDINQKSIIEKPNSEQVAKEGSKNNLIGDTVREEIVKNNASKVIEEPIVDSGDEVVDGGNEGIVEKVSRVTIGITGAVIGGELERVQTPYIVTGEVSKGEIYSHEIGSDRIAKIVQESVKIEGEVVRDDVVVLEIKNNNAEISTDYELVEEGYGEDYEGSESLELSVNLEDFGILAENGVFNVKLAYEGVEIASFSEAIVVDSDRVDSISDLTREEGSRETHDAAGTLCNSIPSGSQCSTDTVAADNTCIDTGGNNAMDTTDYCHLAAECGTHLGASCDYYTGSTTQGICADDGISGTCASMPTSGEHGTGLTNGLAVNFHNGNEYYMCGMNENLQFCTSTGGYDPSAEGICISSTCSTTSPVVALDCTDQDCAVADVSSSTVYDCTSSCSSIQHGFACDSSTTSSGWIQDGMWVYDSATSISDKCMTTGYVCYTGISYYNSHDGGFFYCNTGDACDSTLTNGNFDSTYGTLDSGGNCVAAGGGGDANCTSASPTGSVTCNADISYTTDVNYTISMNFSNITVGSLNVNISGGAHVIYRNVTLIVKNLIVEEGSTVEFLEGTSTVYHNGDWNISGTSISDTETHVMNGTTASPYQINVLGTGNLTVIDGSNITNGDDFSAYYQMNIFGNLTLENSHVSYLNYYGVNIQAGAGYVGIGDINFTDLNTATNAITTASNLEITGEIRTPNTAISVVGNNVRVDCNGNNLINYSLSGEGHGINVSYANNTKIDACEISAGGTGTYTSGISFEYVEGSLVNRSNVYTKGTNSYGIYYSSSNQANASETNVSTDYYGVYLSGSGNVTFKDGKVTTSGASGDPISVDTIYPATHLHVLGSNLTAEGGATPIYGYYTSSSLFANNSITSIGGNANGIYLYGDSDNNVIENNTIYDAGGNGIHIEYNSPSNYPQNNNISENSINTGSITGDDVYIYYDFSSASGTGGTWFIDQAYKLNTYNFANAWPRVEAKAYGLISWNDPSGTGLSETGGNFSENVTIGNLSAFVGSITDSPAGLNSSANITFYFVGDRGFSDPGLYRDGATCTTCSNFTALTENTVVFNNTGWSNYTLVDLGGGSQCANVNPGTNETCTDDITLAGDARYTAAMNFSNITMIAQNINISADAHVIFRNVTLIVSYLDVQTNGKVEF